MHLFIWKLICIYTQFISFQNNKVIDTLIELLLGP